MALPASTRHRLGVMFRCLLFCLLSASASQLLAQQPDETLPGFRPNSVLDVNGSDSVDIFSGGVSVVVPVSPEYSLGPTFKWQLKAYYSSKLWHLDKWDCGSSPPTNTFHALLSGYPSLGAGWNIDLGYWLPNADATGGAYHAPDGSAHNVIFDTAVPPSPTLNQGQTTDGTHLRITQTCAATCSATVEFPDGITETFSQNYAPPSSLTGFAASMDFTDEKASLPLSRTNRIGLTSIKDSFSTTLLQVSYNGDGSGDLWKVTSITLSSLPGAPSITYNWTNLTGQTSNPGWRVLSSIVFPPLQSKSRRVTFLTSARAIIRNAYDSLNQGGAPCFPSAPVSAWAPVLNEIDYADNAAPTTKILKYTFSYDASGSTLTDGLLSSYVMPTGGTVSYTYSTAVVAHPDETVFDPENAGFERAPAPNFPVAPSCPVSNGFLDDAFAADSPVIAVRTASGVTNPMTTQYDRAIYQAVSFPGGCPVYDESHITKVVNVTVPDGNGGQRTTKHLFHYAFVSQSQDSSGMELEERTYSDNNITTTGSLVRTQVFCHESDNTSNPSPNPVCGVLAPDGTGQSYLAFGKNVRQQAAITWFGVNPTGGGDCSQSSSPCVRSDNTVYDTFVGHYGKTTISRLHLTGDWSTRTSETTWVHPPGPAWLLNLFSLKKSTDVVDVGTPSPLITQTNFNFNTATGFLNSSCTNDPSSAQAIQHAYTPELSGKGNPSSDQIAVSSNSSCVSPTVQYTKNWTWTHGLLSTDNWSGVSWNSFDVTRDSTGPVTTSKDPNGLVTNYLYDALGRLTSIAPPGETATFVCYDLPTQTSRYRASSDLGCPNAKPASALTWERSLYDGMGRLSREIRFLPSNYAFRVHNYDSAGHESFLSEWQSCNNPRTQCVNSADPPGTTWSSFDSFGRPERITKADSTYSTITRTDSANGGILESDTQETVTTFNVNSSVAAGPTTTQKDALGRVISVTEPSVGSGADVTAYAHNVLDKLTHVTQGAQDRDFIYDALGFLRSETNPEKGTTTYDLYDALGNLLRKTEGGVIYDYSYDPAGRLWTETANNGATSYLVNCYDGTVRSATQSGCPAGQANFTGGNPPAGFPAGKLTRGYGYNPLFATVPTIQEDFTYNGAGGRLSAKATTLTQTGAQPSSITTNEGWTYNNLGLIFVYTHPHINSDSAVDSTYTYSAGLPATLTSGAANVVSGATYSPAGALASWTAGNGVVTLIDPDTSLIARPLRIHTTGASTNFDSGTYSYDGAGNIKTIGPNTFSYDVRSRLAGSTVFGNAQTFSYDRFGNLNPALVDALSNRLKQILPADYDLLGNLRAFNGATYQYDDLSRQISLNTSVEQYIYDGAGERIARVAGTAAPVTLTGVSLNPTAVTGGSPSTGTVTLSGNAPSGGVSVTLSSNNANATVPSPVVVPQGQASQTFTVNTAGVSCPQTATITASYNGASPTAPLTINASSPVAISFVSMNPATVTAGTSSAGTVTLTCPAPPGGFTINLTSSPSGIVTFSPGALVSIAAGASSGTFTANTASGSSSTTVTITATNASNAGDHQATTLTVNAAGTPQIASVNLTATGVTGGTAVTANSVSLTFAATSTFTINLSLTSSPASGATLTPAQVTVSAGQTVSNTFTVNTAAVGALTTLTVTATNASNPNDHQAKALTVNPPAMSSLTLSPTSLVGGNGATSTATITLNGVAPSGGYPANLSSTDTTAATVPASTSVPANSQTNTFAVTTIGVASTKTPSITATNANNALDTKSATLTVNPAAISSVSCASPVNAGTTSSCTVTLNGGAPPGGASVALLSLNTAVAVPQSSSVTVLANAATTSFNVNALAAGTATIRATYLGVQKTTSLTVNPAVPLPPASISCVPASLAGGNPSLCTVTLTGAAPAGGETVDLTSSDTLTLTVPATTPVMAGSTTSNFTASAIPRCASTPVTVTATAATVPKTTTVTVVPPTMISLTVSPTSVVSGTSSTATITLNGTTACSITYNLTSSNTAAATVPGTAVVSAGTATKTFTVSTLGVSSATVVTITATNASNPSDTRNTTLTVNPASLASITANPNPMSGAATSLGTATLNGLAPPGGALVALSSTNTAVLTVAPASITIPANSSSNTFTNSAACASATTSATVNGVYAGVTRSALVTVNALTISSVTVSPSIIASLDSAVGTVTLSAAVLSSGTGVTVALSSTNDALVSVPGSVDVPSGSSTATFTVDTGFTNTGGSATVRATFCGVTKTASVTVKGFIQAPPPAPSGTSIGVPFESANPNASLTPLPQPGVQLAAAINPGMPWMMTYRDDANRLSTEYTAPASASLPTRTKDYYYFGNLLVATQDAASCGRQYYASDHLGTPRLVTNGSAAAVETHNYLPYGEEITSDTTCTPPLQFCAMERDQASGNDYDHARFSLTGMGRFLGVDRHSGNPESPQSWNRYSYAGNNPVNYLDRDGNVSAYAQDVVARPLENAGAALQSAGASLNNGSAGGVVADFVMSTAGDVVGGIGDLFNVGAGSGEAIGSGQDAMAVTSAIASDAGRAGGLLLMMTGAAESTTSVPTETVQRAMSNAEYQSTQSTGLLRGGREGTHFVSDNVNSNALRAQQRLALPQTPEVRATLEVKKGTFGPPTKVQPNFGMPGGGTERTAVGTVKVKIIRKDPL